MLSGSRSPARAMTDLTFRITRGLADDRASRDGVEDRVGRGVGERARADISASVFARVWATMEASTCGGRRSVRW